MPKCRYLLRFDDACPTMRWENWDRLETFFVAHQIRPIYAVIPDNRDPQLSCASAHPEFWSRVRHWQSLGWTIALHGYQHVYVNQNAGMMRVTKQSEFAGRPREVQEQMLRKGLEIFAREGVRADCWVAPSHSFDRTTIELLHGLGVQIVSDGFWRHPFTDRAGMIWVPQQLWEFKPRPPGTWTICSHPNDWTPALTERFLRRVERHLPQISNLAEVVQDGRERRETLTANAGAHCRWAATKGVGWCYRYYKKWLKPTGKPHE